MAPWDGMWRNRHQLMSRLGLLMPVLYVEPWVPLGEIRRGRVGLKEVMRDLRSRSLVRQVDNVAVLRSPASRPVAHSRRFQRATLDRWIRLVQKHAGNLGIQRPILWVSQPWMAPVLGKLGEVLSVYHVVDEYAGYTGVSAERRERVWAAEQQILDTVDMTIVVSHQLQQAKAGEGRSVHIVPNAVDFEAFRRVEDLPMEIRRIRGPRIGYSGLIGARLDLELIDSVAVSRPDFNFVFVGRTDSRECEATLKRLGSRANVHFLGEKSVSEVPGYLSAFDVGLLPYRNNLETRNISPLKLYEYLAAEKPVVATSIPACRPFESLIYLADSPKDFEAAIDKALAEDTPERRHDRLDVASQNTWEDRIEQIQSLIHDALKRVQTETPLIRGLAP